MWTHKNTRWFYKQRELQEVITACLQLMMDDIRAQYRHVLFEAQRLHKAGVAACDLYDRLGLDRKEVQPNDVPANTDSHVQRTGV